MIDDQVSIINNQLLIIIVKHKPFLLTPNKALLLTLKWLQRITGEQMLRGALESDGAGNTWRRFRQRQVLSHRAYYSNGFSQVNLPTNPST